MAIKQIASVTFAALVLTVATAPAAFSQTDRSGNPAAGGPGPWTGRGETSGLDGNVRPPRGTADRRGVKSETRTANKSGGLTNRGETNGLDGIVQQPKSTANRQQIKAETKAAVRAGQIPSGER
jgi:hypothetical protein